VLSAIESILGFLEEAECFFITADFFLRVVGGSPRGGHKAEELLIGTKIVEILHKIVGVPVATIIDRGAGNELISLLNNIGSDIAEIDEIRVLLHELDAHFLVLALIVVGNILSARLNGRPMLTAEGVVIPRGEHSIVNPHVLAVFFIVSVKRTRPHPRGRARVGDAVVKVV
jgi:hypothetical protein